jgi:RNA polymerase sigma-70 factor (ECF subfamily)
MDDTTTAADAVGEVDDSVLVAAAQAGDAVAMNQLLGRHFNYVTALCRRMLKDQYRAEDARQDALFQAARRIATFDGRASFRTWLHAITRNVCLNEIRSQARRATVPIDDESMPARVAHDRIAERLDVESALAAVNPVFRDALVLWFMFDMSYNDISDILGVELNTVRSRLRRGKEELKQLLGEPGGVPPVSNQLSGEGETRG